MWLILGVTALHWVNEELALNTDFVMAKDTDMEATMFFCLFVLLNGKCLYKLVGC